jgi:cellulose synthase/poly-beta-1,6-N-acetylglucosamine synthase-like glycosyltransferase
MMPPAASIIVAVYNGQRTLKECLDSLLRLDYPKARREVIVVDNGSGDATPEILDAYAHMITVVHEARRGAAAARNTGLHHAKGDVVAFTDADCVAAPDWLERIAVPLKDPTVGVVGGRILARRPCGRIAGYGERVHDHARAIERVRPPYAIGMNWASRRAVLDAAGGFNARLMRCEDVDLAYRLVRAGYGLVYEPSAIIYHHNRSTVRALIRQGYQHGYHAVQVRMLHAAFLSRYGHPRRARRARDVVAFGARLARSGVHNLPWALLFELAKVAGHLHGTVAAAAQPRERRTKA